VETSEETHTSNFSVGEIGWLRQQGVAGPSAITLRVSLSHEIFTSRNALLRIIGSRD